ncbi:hypothetical protein PCANC_17749 [Puccinia coronata f. sp. avenae]|uniref:Uncharacterized protein n=1 Tax=Puccinia coronata f. sp. avenae TaxID=200324 RepID=A0A2N5UYR1_9BASI|nr:hypothetical protein PCASD_11939 [Puccinia coronata f. sp. avenae]PLW42898.1 hypothetical protein PCANC_17749 [Puccinia coronata f. sp. avenae]
MELQYIDQLDKAEAPVKPQTYLGTPACSAKCVVKNTAACLVHRIQRPPPITTQPRSSAQPDELVNPRSTMGRGFVKLGKSTVSGGGSATSYTSTVTKSQGTEKHYHVTTSGSSRCAACGANTYHHKYRHEA